MSIPPASANYTTWPPTPGRCAISTSSPTRQDIVTELRAELLEWLITTTRPTTVSGVNSARFGAPTALNRQRQQRYQTVVNRDGKINPRRLHDLKNKNYL